MVTVLSPRNNTERGDLLGNQLSSRYSTDQIPPLKLGSHQGFLEKSGGGLTSARMLGDSTKRTTNGQIDLKNTITQSTFVKRTQNQDFGPRSCRQNSDGVSSGNDRLGDDQKKGKFLLNEDSNSSDQKFDDRASMLSV